MHDLVDDAASQGFDGQFLIGGHRAQASAHAIDFGLANRFEMILQADDGRNDVERLQAGVKFFDLAVDDGFGLFGFLLAIGDVGTDRLLQIVDVVDEDAVELVHLRIDVARDGDIDEEHGPVLAARQELLAVFGLEDEVGRAGRGDDDVGAVAGVVEPAELDRLPVEFLRQADGAIVGAIGDEDRRGAVRQQMAGRQFAHLPCADQVDALAVQGAEDLLGQFDRDRGDRNRGRSDRGLGAHALGDGKGAGEQLIELRAHGADRAGGGIGFLDLAENLRLADDHRVEAGGDAEDVADRFIFAKFVEMTFELAEIDLEILAQEFAQIARAILHVGDEFHAVAGGNDHALGNGGMLGQSLAGLGQARFGNRQALAHFDRRGLVIHADELESHEAINLCIPLK